MKPAVAESSVRRHIGRAAWLAVALCACGPDLKSPAGAAEAFADRYYVRADLGLAAELVTGDAAKRLARESGLADTARGGRQDAPPQGTQSRVYYERGAVAIEGERAVVNLKLRIQPPDGSAPFHKSTLLTLSRRDGRWFVSDIAEETGPQ